QGLDAAGPRRRVVIAEVELRRVAKTDAPAEERTDPRSALLEREDHVARLLLVEAAHEDAGEVEVRADLDLVDRGQALGDVLHVVAENLNERIAQHFADPGGAPRLPHEAQRITRNRRRFASRLRIAFHDPEDPRARPLSRRRPARARDRFVTDAGVVPERAALHDDIFLAYERRVSEPPFHGAP